MWMPMIWVDDDTYNTMNQKHNNSNNNNTESKNNSNQNTSQNNNELNTYRSYEPYFPMDPVDRMFHDFWEDGLQATSSMKTDVVESDHDYKVTAEFPGFNKEDIQVDVKGGNLIISASHKEDNDQKDSKGRYIRRERRAASYHRSFHLGDEYKPEDVTAKFENGVLTLTIPKKGQVVEQAPESRVKID